MTWRRFLALRIRVSNSRWCSLRRGKLLRPCSWCLWRASGIFYEKGEVIFKMFEWGKVLENWGRFCKSMSCGCWKSDRPVPCVKIELRWRFWEFWGDLTDCIIIKLFWLWALACFHCWRSNPGRVAPFCWLLDMRVGFCFSKKLLFED